MHVRRGEARGLYRLVIVTLLLLLAHEASASTLLAAPLRIDEQLSEGLRALAPEGGALYTGSEWVSDVGAPLAVGYALYHVWEKESRAGERALHALLLTGLATYAGKVLTGRARPDAPASGWLGPSLDDAYHSFPSGHASVAFAAAALLSAEEPEWKEEAYATAGLIALTRLLLGRHWPSDVVAGALLGTAIGRHYAGKPLLEVRW